MADTDEFIARLLGRVEGLAGETPPLDGVYDELKALAERLMRRERRSHTLQATALVHEAYVRLAGSRNLEGADRLRFMDAAAVTMRRILVDHARRVQARGKVTPVEQVTLSGTLDRSGEQDLDLIHLQDSLVELEELDPRAAKAVELRFFAGMTGGEIAQHLDTSRNTVVRDLAMARAWLKRKLEKAQEGKTD